ncbi:hypothetical protein M5K25_019694 [Dendrobium thyrsiflorum]|uniref:Uncharacterized protein n=1 Tax=Dendrobium thyrsiflorum TaxID=117978 RepID=A0ABD0UMH7_DENTH
MDARTRWAPVIPTGSLKLDQALGIGGLPKANYNQALSLLAQSNGSKPSFHVNKDVLGSMQRA